MNVKALLKEYFGTEEFKRARKLAKLRTAKIAEVKGKIAGFLRGDESLAAFADGIKHAVEDQTPLEPDGPPAHVWGFGGSGTSHFIAALLKAAPEPKIEAELRRALAGIDTRDPSDRLRTFAAFVARAAKEANLGPETSLHVGYATCFLSFCWHALYDLEVPVFYGSSHRGVKSMIAGGLIADPEYASRDLAERFRAFLRITRGLLELVRKVSPQLNFWTVESFLEWAAPRFEVASVGSASAMLQQVELGGLRGATSSQIPVPQSGALALAGAAAPGAGSMSGYYRALQMGATPAAPPAHGHAGTGSPQPEGSGRGFSSPVESFRVPPAPSAPAVTIGTAPSGPGFDDTHSAPLRGRTETPQPEDAKVDTRRQKPKTAEEEERAKAIADVKQAMDDAKRAEDDAKAKAEADARAKEEAAKEKAEADAKAKEKAEADAKAQAEADAARAKAEADAAKAKADADAKARADADAKAKADAEEKSRAAAKAKADAEEKTRAEAKAKSEADAKAKADAEAAEAKARAEAEAKAREENEARARKEAEAAAAKKEADARAAEALRAKAAAAAAPPAPAAEVPGLPPPSPAPAGADATARRLSPFAPSATTRMTRPQAPAQSKEDALAALGKETRFPEKLLKDLDVLLERRGQVALEGPTGAGKTLLARRFAAIFAGSGQRVRVVQFHPSFKYEDFIEGPAHLAGASGPGAAAPSGPVGLLGGTHHAPQGAAHGANPGVLKQFAQKAARDPQNRYVMVLDDLGRADAIAVLGEVFSLLEFREQEVVLPYSREAFALPKNLYFVATACATQQARGLADPALRRRFPFMQIEPSADALRGFLEEKKPDMAWVADVFAELNRRISKEAGPRAQIGQSIFMQSNLDEPELERIFAYDVRPLLEASVEPSKLAKLELAALKKAAR